MCVSLGMEMTSTFISPILDVMLQSRKERRERIIALHSLMSRFRADYEVTRFTRNPHIAIDDRKSRSLGCVAKYNDLMQGMSHHGLPRHIASKYRELKQYVYETWKMDQKEALDLEQWRVRHIDMGKRLGMVLGAIGGDPNQSLLSSIKMN